MGNHAFDGHGANKMNLSVVGRWKTCFPHLWRELSCNWNLRNPSENDILRKVGYFVPRFLRAVPGILAVPVAHGRKRALFRPERVSAEAIQGPMEMSDEKRKSVDGSRMDYPVGNRSVGTDGVQTRSKGAESRNSENHLLARWGDDGDGVVSAGDIQNGNAGQ